MKGGFIPRICYSNVKLASPCFLLISFAWKFCLLTFCFDVHGSIVWVLASNAALMCFIRWTTSCNGVDVVPGLLLRSFRLPSLQWMIGLHCGCYAGGLLMLRAHGRSVMAGASIVRPRALQKVVSRLVGCVANGVLGDEES